MTAHRLRVVSTLRGERWWHKAVCRDCTSRAAGWDYQEQEDWAISHLLRTRTQIAKEAAA